MSLNSIDKQARIRELRRDLEQWLDSRPPAQPPEVRGSTWSGREPLTYTPEDFKGWRSTGGRAMPVTDAQALAQLMELLREYAALHGDDEPRAEQPGEFLYAMM